MRLTSKDKAFLERLKALLHQEQLSIELKEDGCKRFVLRQNYGDKIARHFGMSRQGVRWRFQRLFNEVYVEAYERIWWIEANFGSELRHHAMAIAKERIELRKKVQKMNITPPHRRPEADRSSATTRRQVLRKMACTTI